MEEQEYEYHAVYARPTDEEIKEKWKEGWEPCAAPEGVIGRDVSKEPTYPHSNFYFRRKVLSRENPKL